MNADYRGITAATTAVTRRATIPVIIHRQSPNHNHPNAPAANSAAPTATTGCSGSSVVIMERVGPQDYGFTGGATVCIDQETRDQTTATSGRPRNGVPPFTAVRCPPSPPSLRQWGKAEPQSRHQPGGSW